MYYEYAAYARNLTNDVKLALILQTFEPISNGRQAAYYVQKFIMLYITVILTELGIDYKQFQSDILKILKKWNGDFLELYTEGYVK